MSRECDLNELVAERIVESIRRGSYATQAAQAAGIARSTYYRWLARGEAEEVGPYRDLLERVRQAEAEAEEAALGAITSAFGEYWQCAAWYLERKFPERWARQERFDEAAYVRELSSSMARKLKLDDELLVQLVQLLLKEGA